MTPRWAPERCSERTIGDLWYTTLFALLDNSSFQPGSFVNIRTFCASLQSRK